MGTRVPSRRVHRFDRLEQASRSLRELRARCLLYTSDAADERSSVDLGGRRIIKKKKKKKEQEPGWKRTESPKEDEITTI